MGNQKTTKFIATIKCMDAQRLLDTPGKRIKLLREDRKLSQLEFAELVSKSGVKLTNTHLSEIERVSDKDLNNLSSPKVLAAIAKTLNTTMDYLMLFSDDPFPPRTNENQIVIEASNPEERVVLKQLFETIKDFRIEDMHYILDMLQFMRGLEKRASGIAKLIRGK